jgi:hypothetical protein
MSGIALGALCGVLGITIFILLLVIENVQCERAGRVQHWFFGLAISRSHRPSLFRALILYRWFCVGLLGLGAIVLARSFFWFISS